MPIQAPQWTDYLNCPVCCREFGAPPRSPISLSCGHTICKHCLANLHRRQCPFDQTVIQLEPEELVVNTALLQLAGYTAPAQPYHPPCIKTLSEIERRAYDVIVHCMEELATYLKFCGNASNNSTGGRLSRPMQRKLVTLVQCAVTDSEGRGRTARAARSLGERTVTELILQHQSPQQLSANLWAAVRARGCQFLGPAMQEEVLKLVLLALEDGSALSRKVLVLFIVQRLEPHFPQASKTSIGHVVQLLYRASCFKVSKRECDSSLMQLKEEFRSYDSLRREHDAQIVQIATEAGLRIAPDQWSALLYGDAVHKSQMQSIIDKLQTPQSFAQSIQELFIALQRTGDPAHLSTMSLHLDRLASIDASPEAKSPSWERLADVLSSLREVVSGLIQYLQQQGIRDSNHNRHLGMDRPGDPPKGSPNRNSVPVPVLPGNYQVIINWDPEHPYYTFAGPLNYVPTEQELEQFRNSRAGSPNMNANYGYRMPRPPMAMGSQLASPQLPAGISQPPNGMVQPPNGMVQPRNGIVQPRNGIVQPRNGMVQPPVGIAQPPVGIAQPPMYVSPPPYAMMCISRPPPPPPPSQQEQRPPGNGPNIIQRGPPPPLLAEAVDLMQQQNAYQQMMMNGQPHSGFEMTPNEQRPMGDRPRFENVPYNPNEDVSYFSDMSPGYNNFSPNYPFPYGSSQNIPMAEQQLFHGPMDVHEQMLLQGQRGPEHTFMPMQAEQVSRDLSPYAFDSVTSDLLADSYRAMNPRRTSPWGAQEDVPVFGYESMLEAAIIPLPTQPPPQRSDEIELEHEIQELERRLDMELEK